jgi:hypothetical protein
MLLLAMTLMATPVALQAQSEAERGQLWDVQIIKVRPDHMDEFMGTAAMVKEAAEAANLDAKYAWYMWMQDFEVAIASPAPDMATFDDPTAWMRAFAGTPGEAMVTQAMNTFNNEIAAQPGTREVWEHVGAWSFAPAEPSFETPSYAERHDFWIKPGMAEAFDGVAKDIMAFFADMGGIYPINGYRIHFGDAGRVSFLVFNDGWGDFYGANSMEGALEATGKTAEWEALMTKLRDCITNSETSQMEHLAELTYTGPGM